jgi:murein DD-endopeptidase MepM/ murein hydrolase activator NlpD
VSRPWAAAGVLIVSAVLGACATSTKATPPGGSLPPIAAGAPTTAAIAAAAGPASGPPSSGSSSAAPAGTTATSTTVVTSLVTSESAVTTTTARPTTTPYVIPVQAGVKISYAHVHGGYPATDIFASTGCGTPLVSPVNGQILQTRRVDGWTKKENNPALRGGLSVAILGDDGVRYYLAHFQEIDATIQPGVAVAAGERLGEMGESGDAGACHVHFGISMPCPGLEWSIRRGLIWPWPYLDSWRSGGQASPQLEIVAWAFKHPDACAAAMADPDAALSG